MQSLLAMPSGGFALHGYLKDLGKPTGMTTWYWYALRGDARGEVSWGKGYAPAGPNGGQGRAIAACEDGLVLVGSTYTPEQKSWVVRTNEKGEVPFAPPGSTIDL